MNKSCQIFRDKSIEWLILDDTVNLDKTKLISIKFRVKDKMFLSMTCY